MLCFIPLTACIHHLHILGHVVAAPDPIMTVSSFPYHYMEIRTLLWTITFVCRNFSTAFNTCSRPFMEDAHSDITLRPAVN